MICIQASGFAQFLTVHGLFHGSGVDVVAGGGNALAVPDDTDRTLLRAAAAMGASVYADLDVADQVVEPVTEPPGSTDATPEPTRKPRKTTRSKTTRE